MALLSNSKTSFDGLKENLGDVISNIYLLVFMSYRKVSSSTKVMVKGLTRITCSKQCTALRVVYSATSQSDVTRLNNNTQISAKSLRLLVLKMRKAGLATRVHITKQKTQKF